ncbi:non-ribosomal peptide synthetase [Paenibacillus kobensis]|uniref:non-ribosomal peptide synthetase n=1 Tax=Paenibacillus kobensis TaxID=59841 RepID=UPI0013E350C4|nr:non-ribosomal peptide synthetase [Paenibacillus kobensis]
MKQWKDIYLTDHAECLWERMYADATSLLNLPYDKTVQPDTVRYRATVTIDLACMQKVVQTAEAIDCAVEAVLLAAYFLLLSRYTSQHDLLVGVLTEGQGDTSEDVEAENIVSLRSFPESGKTFSDLALEVNSSLNIARTNLSGHRRLMEKWLANEAASVGEKTLFETAFCYSGANEGGTWSDRLRHLPKTCPLSIDIGYAAEAWYAEFEHGSTLNPLFIERMLKNYIHILEEVPQKTESRLALFEAINPLEKQTLIFGFNDTSKSHSDSRPIFHRIQEQAARDGSLTAVYYEGKAITYAEINNSANYYADLLIAQGIGKGCFVPILMRRSVDVVIAELAIMKSGAAFVPLDVSWPLDRIGMILEEVGCDLILVHEECRETASHFNQKQICVSLRSDERTTNPDVVIDLNDPIYVIYTSGSTGKPKGAINLHKGILNSFNWRNHYLGWESSRRTYQIIQPTVDGSVWQMFWPLTTGGAVVIPKHNLTLKAERICEDIEKYQIAIMTFVPSIFDVIVSQLETNPELYKKLSSLTIILIGGEEIVPETVYRFQKRMSAIRIINFYGPTEATIACIYHKVTGAEAKGVIPIGKPISNVKALLLSADRNLVPIGAIGEVYITGDCLGAGYLHNIKRTQEAFVPNPYPEMETDVLYKTGDLGRLAEDGTLYYLGRIDYQVKIRGFRVELEEIESVLRQYQGVNKAVVVLKKDRYDKQHLCAYYESEVPFDEELKQHLPKKLPSYMVPSLLIWIDQIPLTSNGKVDRKSLRDPFLNTDRYMEEATSPLQTALLKLWSRVLGIDGRTFGIDDDFFSLGGTSLLSVMIDIGIEEIAKRPVDLAVYRHRTIRELSSFIEALH